MLAFACPIVNRAMGTAISNALVDVWVAKFLPLSGSWSAQLLCSSSSGKGCVSCWQRLDQHVWTTHICIGVPLLFSVSTPFQ